MRYQKTHHCNATYEKFRKYCGGFYSNPPGFFFEIANSKTIPVFRFHRFTLTSFCWEVYLDLLDEKVYLATIHAWLMLIH